MPVVTLLIDLSADECATRLAAESLGRLAVLVDGRPEIFPVNHVYDRETGCVAFPTSFGTKLHGALEWPWVAFEVDGVAPDGSKAWSVVVVGRAEKIADAATVKRLSSARLVLWADNDSSTWLRIVPTKVTGRCITARHRSGRFDR